MSVWKEAVVYQLSHYMKKSKVIGVITTRGMPSRQLQIIKKSLGADIIMARKRLIMHAMRDNEREGFDKLRPYIEDQPALLFSTENPFKLYSKISKSRAPAPAKGGEVAPNDIVVEKGETPFAPGPVLGELKGIGLNVGIDKGKIVVKEPKVVVRRGDVIKPNVAEMITRLGIEPMEIGLDMLAAWEDGFVFDKSVLAIDEEEYFNSFMSAYRGAFNLSVNSAFTINANIDFLLGRCHRQSFALAEEAGIINAATVDRFLAKASAQASTLNQQINFVKEV